eukprot:g16069.t1
MMTRTVISVALAVVACLVSSAAAFVSGVGAVLRTSCVPATSTTQHVYRRDAHQQLRAAADDGEEGGGFVNPYTAFRKWQMELIDSKAKGDEKYPEAVAGLMKEPGMTKEKAERLAKLSVQDPILYAIERRREANEINNTKMDYDKISGFFPMEWIMSGDFGWGFNKKKRRLAEEEAAKANKKK